LTSGVSLVSRVQRQLLTLRRHFLTRETDHARLVDHALKAHHGDAVSEIVDVEAG
jgi:hypothetical protein